MRILRAVAALSCAALTALTGCGSDPEPPAQYGGYMYRGQGNPYANYYGYQAAAAAAAPTPMPMPMPSTGNESSVHIDNRIIQACGDLPTAHFAFDSANVLPDSASALDALARCFVSGPLRSKGMKLVGHADPRGETEYNLALGHQRAYSVLDLLAQRGIEIGRMTTSSKGEFDAVGGDESGWARDRKVEIVLAD
jgi:peptidoglycan-associated lipoprotein